MRRLLQSATACNVTADREAEFLTAIQKLENQVKLGLEGNRALEQELEATVAKLHNDVAAGAGSVAGESSAEALQLEYARVLTKLMDELKFGLECNAKLEAEVRASMSKVSEPAAAPALAATVESSESQYQDALVKLQSDLQHALASNGKLEDEFKAFVAKASSDLGQMSRGGGDDAAADKKKVAAEADCARALSDFKAELQQALAANGKLEEELRKAVSAAPDAAAGAQSSSMADVESKYAVQLQELRKHLQETLQMNSVLESEVKLATEGVHMLHSSFETLLEEKDARIQELSASSTAAGLASSAAAEVAELTARIEALQDEAQQATAGLEEAKTNCEQALAMQRQLETALAEATANFEQVRLLQEQMVPKAQVEELEVRVKQLTEERDQIKAACDSALQRCQEATRENEALQTLTSAAKDPEEAASSNAAAAPESGPAPATSSTGGPYASCIQALVDLFGKTPDVLALTQEQNGTAQPVMEQKLADLIECMDKAKACLASLEASDAEREQAMAELTSLNANLTGAVHRATDAVSRLQPDADQAATSAPDAAAVAEVSSEIVGVVVAQAAAEVDYTRALSHVQAELQQALAANGKLEEELRKAVSAAPAVAAVAEAAAEVDYARALSHVQAELQQALAANGKLEEELRRAVSAAPAQAEEASSKIASAGATRNRAV